LRPGVRPRTRVSPWPRGGGKSTSGELGIVRVGAKLTRRFALYVCETQDQADKHVQTISTRFEALGIGRSVSKYGHSKGWRRDQLRTDHGFNVAALGADAASRGIKLDDFRPDLIVIDDIDGRHDSEAIIKKKIEILTQSILPAGAPDLAVVVLQNPITKDSIVSQLVDGRADFLLDREVAKPEPAVLDLQYERRFRDDGTAFYVIVGGRATWEGQDLATCEAQMNLWGRSAFLREAQHRVDEEEGGLWSRSRDIEPFRVSCPPHLARIGVAIDPSASAHGDEAGIIVAGLGYLQGVPHGYVLDDCSQQGSPRQWAMAAVAAHHKYHCTVPIVAEANNGGEMVEVTISTVDHAPAVEIIHASRGKITRADPVQSLYEKGYIHHVGEFPKLESEMCTWQPGDPSPNRMDALVWILTKLMLSGNPGVVAYPATAQGVVLPQSGPLANWQRQVERMRYGR